MSITYPSSIVNLRLSDVFTALDSGSSYAILTVLSTNNSIMANVTLAKPSANISSGIAIFNGIPFTGTVLIDGAATTAKFTTTEGLTVISLSAGTGAGVDLQFSPTNVMSAGQSFAMNLGQITGR